MSRLVKGKYSGIYGAFIGNDTVYVGQSIDVRERIIGHRSLLKRQKHGNPILQRIYNKYGTKLEFDLIDLVPEKDLSAMENYWMNVCRPKANILPAGGTTSLEFREYLRKKYTGRPNLALKGKKQRPEDIAKRVASRVSANRKLSEDHKQILRERMIGNTWGFKKGQVSAYKGYKASPELKKKLRDASVGKKWSDERKDFFKAAISRIVRPQWSDDQRAKHGQLIKAEYASGKRVAVVGKKNSDAAKEKMRVKATGRKMSPEAIAKRLETLKKTGGLKWTEERRKKWSAKFKEGLASGKYSAVRPKGSKEPKEVTERRLIKYRETIKKRKEKQVSQQGLAA